MNSTKAVVIDLQKQIENKSIISRIGITCSSNKFISQALITCGADEVLFCG